VRQNIGVNETTATTSYESDDLSPTTGPGRRSFFDRFAHWASKWSGRPVAFIAAAVLVLLWGFSYPLFKDFDTWQLVINTTTTIITFLMVFLIQSTQNRDTAAVHIKLDELIRAIEGAHNALLDLEELNEKDLSRIRENYEKLAAKAREVLRQKSGIGSTNGGSNANGSSIARVQVEPAQH
jgi:low affinity Fe/Cu permease